MKKKRPWIVLAVALLIGGLLVWKKRAIQYTALSWMVLHESAPGEVAMREMVDSSTDPIGSLQKLWDTRQIVQREFVGNYVRERSNKRVDRLWPQERALALTAACDCGDFETQQAALGVLSNRDDPQLVPVALGMLNDIDPGVRSLGMVALGQLNDSRFVPVFARMVNDPDQGVRAYAAAALSVLTNQDLELKFHGSDPDAATRLAQWEKWWSANSKKFDPGRVPAPAALTGQPLGVAPEFALPDVDGKTVRLSDLRGKPVLLVFWSAASPGSKALVEDLSELQRRRGSDMALLAIEAGSERLKESVDQVRQFVADQQVPFRVLIDSKATALAAYSGGDFPAAVWIDKTGLIRRRFVGPRNEKVLEQMLDWVNG